MLPDQLGGLVAMPATATVFTTSMQLDRGAGDGAIRTENAAITGLGAQNCAASLAVIKILAGIGRHGFGFDMPAFRAGQNRDQFDMIGISLLHRL